ncbi:hypothetical protein LJ707_00945 [Mucilaginibacter sp. UR6-1]|uniref:hypothetical protein n=1 Tax=Mucilaginibacter sp. UR6-1 TaxID=1435643 RepID=UPI001E4147F4|nr:hypothetical protein [Mucilaginibacter sp. UR6-1]MCC8407477.1 hypothetical protein [Mucilaginibacter sp. UR6-1]
MKRLTTLIFHFYRPLFFINLVFSFCAIFDLIKFGLRAMPIVIIIKLFGYLVCISYQYFFSAKSYFYYRNAGLSARLMYTYIFILDILLFILLSTIILIPFYALTHLKG